MTTTTANTKTEAVAVRAVGNGALNLQPSWTKYPADYRPVKGLTANIFSGIEPGKTYTFTFQRENLKTGKDGSADFHYFWGVAGVDRGAGGVPAPAASEPAQPPKPQATRAYGNMDEETTRRITFLSALNAAATYLHQENRAETAESLHAAVVLAGAWADAAFAYGRGEAVDPLDMFPPTETAPEARTAPVGEAPAADHSPAPKQGSQAQSDAVPAKFAISDAQRRRLFALCKENAVTEEQLRLWLGLTYGLGSTTELTRDQYEATCNWVQSRKPAEATK